MKAATVYASALRTGDFLWTSTSIVDNLDSVYHPAITKLLFAAGSVIAGRDGTPEMLAPMRAVSVVFGTLGLFVVGLASPLAAALLAFHTLAVAYTSEADLERRGTVRAIQPCPLRRSGNDGWRMCAGKRVAARCRVDAAAACPAASGWCTARLAAPGTPHTASLLPMTDPLVNGINT